MPIHYSKPLILTLVLFWVLPAFSQGNFSDNPADSDISTNTGLDASPAEFPSLDMEISPDPGNTLLSTQVNEIILLIENTPHLQSLDMQQIVESFSMLDQEAYLGIITFSDQVAVLQPLATKSDLDQETLTNVMENISFDGSMTDIGRAIERTVYELKYNGQDSAGKNIIVISGSIEVNDQTGGLETASIPVSAITDISQYDINLEVATFTIDPAGDIEQLFNEIPGTVFHYMESASDLGSVLGTIFSQFQTDALAGTTDSELTLPPQPAPQVQQAQSQPQVDTPAPAVTPAIGEEERTRTAIIVIAAFILFVTLGALIVLLYLRMKKLSGKSNVEIGEAFLKDIHGYTSNKRYQLGKKATMLGRVAGKDDSNLDYIVIPESTIGRRHAVIEYKDYAYWIMDQGSINGTFVNNIPVTSEVRLKQGDIVRLHKFEFEFSIPELDDAGMTKISNTVMSEHIQQFDAIEPPELDEARESISGAGMDLDFGPGEPVQAPAKQQAPAGAADETLLPGHEYEQHDTGNTDDETLMPDSGPAGPVDMEISAGKDLSEAHESDSPAAAAPEDETLMPGLMDDTDEDDTIRPNKNLPDEDK